MYIKRIYLKNIRCFEEFELEFKKRGESALCETVMQYARVSLLVFFQLKDTLEKERLINKLDNSLLDTDSCNKLKEFILSEVFFKQ